jgi:hypothetical protein
VGGEVRGNYSTLSPLYGGATGITNGNLDVTLSGGTQYGSMSLTTGKWYWEITGTASLTGSYLGVMDSTFIKTDATWGTTTTSTYVNNGNQYGIGGTGAYGATYTTGDVIGFALDLDNGTMVFNKNGTSQGTASTGMTGREWRPMLYASGGTYACNFGQRPFSYTAPSGFKALCTQNLPTPTIGATTATQANKYFDTVLRTGAGGATYSTTVNMANGALLWDKPRNQASSHFLFDSVRGIANRFSSNLTNAETSSPTWYTNFGTNSYTTGADDWASPTTLVDWIWAAGTGTTNTAGSITSTVGANTTSGFSVVTYTGTGANATVGHGLGVAPSMVITKSRSDVGGWAVYHISTGASYYLLLNGTSTAANEPTLWNNTAPTSTRFSIGTSGAANTSAATYVAYCFAPIAGYSAFGSYTGNGSADGPFVFTGFRPAFVMFKVTTVADEWRIYDEDRLGYNTVASVLVPNSSIAEETTSAPVDLLSNGFKIRGTAGSNVINGSNQTYIFMAFASNPFKYSLAR